MYENEKKNLGEFIKNMNEFTISELGLFIAGLGTVMTGLIFALQKSRCQKISCCGIKCDRKIKETDGADDQPAVNP
jgi:hypothetical protein